MGNRLNLEYTRFVAQVSNGSPRSKGTYLAMMAENEIALSACEWHESTAEKTSVALPVNNVFLQAGYLDDRYDAYIRGGNANSGGTDTFIGYAGMVAYRFTMPRSYTSGTQHLTELSAVVSRDRYLRAGVRLVVVASNEETPSEDWAVVRGEVDGAVRTQSSVPDEATPGMRSVGLLGQPDVSYTSDTRAAEATVTVDLSGMDSSSRPKYVYVYLTLEDYQNRWLWHSNGSRREYWIEGSAMLVGASNAFSWDAPVVSDGAADDGGAEMTVIQEGGKSPTFLVPFVKTFAKYIQGGGSSTSKYAAALAAAPSSTSGDGFMFAGAKAYGAGAFADTAYQVSSGMKGGATGRDTFRRLVSLSDTIIEGTLGGVANNMAGGTCYGVDKDSNSCLVATVGVPADEVDGVILTPRLGAMGIGYQDVYEQNGLSVYFSASTNTEDEIDNLAAYNGGSSVATQSNVPSGATDAAPFVRTIIKSPSFIVVSALAIRSSRHGSRLSMRAVEPVPNVGLTLRFAIYRAKAHFRWSGAFGFCNIGQMLRASGLVRNLDVGSTFVAPSLPDGAITFHGLRATDIGGFDVTCIGVTGDVSGIISKDSTFDVGLSEEIEKGDVLLIVPVPMAVSSADSKVCYFGQSSDPSAYGVTAGADSTHNRVWARQSWNRGWFPEVSIG